MNVSLQARIGLSRRVLESGLNGMTSSVAMRKSVIRQTIKLASKPATHSLQKWNAT